LGQVVRPFPFSLISKLGQRVRCYIRCSSLHIYIFLAAAAEPVCWPCFPALQVQLGLDFWQYVRLFFFTGVCGLDLWSANMQRICSADLWGNKCLSPPSNTKLTHTQTLLLGDIFRFSNNKGCLLCGGVPVCVRWGCRFYID